VIPFPLPCGLTIWRPYRRLNPFPPPDPLKPSLLRGCPPSRVKPSIAFTVIVFFSFTFLSSDPVGDLALSTQGALYPRALVVVRPFHAVLSFARFPFRKPPNPPKNTPPRTRLLSIPRPPLPNGTLPLRPLVLCGTVEAGISLFSLSAVL